MKTHLKTFSLILFCLFLGNIGYSQNIEPKRNLEKNEKGSTTSLVKEHKSEMKIIETEEKNEKGRNTLVKKQPAVAEKEMEMEKQKINVSERGAKATSVEPKKD
jgi:hypothetical protein